MNSPPPTGPAPNLESASAGSKTCTPAQALLTEGIPWQALSKESRAVAATIGQKLSEGYTHREIATLYGLSPGTVSARIVQLRQELEQVAGIE